MMDDKRALQAQLIRQIAHWQSAVITLDDPANFAAAGAWSSLERYLDTAIRAPLQAAVNGLKAEIQGAAAQLASASSLAQLEAVRARLIGFRRRFTQVETILDFYGDAVNTRTSPRLAGLLHACDLLAERSMRQVLAPLGRETPPVLTYIDKGLGASILRAGLRLWDGSSISPAAAIKITRHNLYRPTSLLHEAGHQVAHVLGWNDELAEVLRRETGTRNRELGSMWASWSSEIAADVFAFSHAGYGAVAALHDVVAGESDNVLRIIPGDPHPMAYLRVLLNTQMCVRFFGSGAWDDLALAWKQVHAVTAASPAIRALVEQSLPLLPAIVELCLLRPMRAFGARPITALVNPERVRPDALLRLGRDAGPALLSSYHWIQTEPLLLLALSTYRSATQPEMAAATTEQYEGWMLRLGQSFKATA